MLGVIAPMAWHDVTMAIVAHYDELESILRRCQHGRIKLMQSNLSASFVTLYTDVLPQIIDVAHEKERCSPPKDVLGDGQADRLAE